MSDIKKGDPIKVGEHYGTVTEIMSGHVTVRLNGAPDRSIPVKDECATVTNNPQAPYERKPMLSNEELLFMEAESFAEGPEILGQKTFGLNLSVDPVAMRVRSVYENLISSGDLIRRDELVAWLESRIRWNKGAYADLGEANHQTGAAFGLQGGSHALQLVLDHINKKP